MSVVSENNGYFSNPSQHLHESTIFCYAFEKFFISNSNIFTMIRHNFHKQGP